MDRQGRRRQSQPALSQLNSKYSRSMSKRACAESVDNHCPLQSLLNQDASLLVLDAVDNPLDRAALALTLPRLALAAEKVMPPYDSLAFRIAVWIRSNPNNRVDDHLLRKYAADARADPEDFDALASMPVNEHGLRLVCEQDGDDHDHWYWRMHTSRWRYGRAPRPVVVRINAPQGSCHFDGWGDVARLVRFVDRAGNQIYYEGGPGNEQKFRKEFESGRVQHYLGEKGAERLVQATTRSGSVVHYQGEKGAERKWKVEYYRSSLSAIVPILNTVQYYEGGKGAERMAKAETKTETTLLVRHFVGKKGAEQKVMQEKRDLITGTSAVTHYLGKKGEERPHFRVGADGTVTHFALTATIQ